MDGWTGGWAGAGTKSMVHKAHGEDGSGFYSKQERKLLVQQGWGRDPVNVFKRSLWL